MARGTRRCSSGTELEVVLHREGPKPFGLTPALCFYFEKGLLSVVNAWHDFCSAPPANTYSGWDGKIVGWGLGVSCEEYNDDCKKTVEVMEMVCTILGLHALM